MSLHLTLTPRDPLVARDGRPFGQGARMKSLDWPYPSVLAGSLRSLLGKAAGGDFSEAAVQTLKAIDIAGPLPCLDGELYFPAAKDLLVFADDARQRQAMPLRPQALPKGAGCNLPGGALWPVAVDAEAKPAPAPAFWSSRRMAGWLLDKPFIPPENGAPGSGFLDAPAKDERMHVSIDPDTYAAEEGLLFMTAGLDMGLPGQAGPVTLAARIEAGDAWRGRLERLDALHPFGGERRLAHWRAEPAGAAWRCPDELGAALRQTKAVRLVLATPALFARGWLPGWLDARTLAGRPPGTSSLRLRLVGGCVERWRPISGWGLENGAVGPKPVRRLTPAGSVYFFTVEAGSAAELAGPAWLRSVADEAQDRRDGFGLGLWGIWHPPTGDN